MKTILSFFLVLILFLLNFETLAQFNAWIHTSNAKPCPGVEISYLLEHNIPNFNVVSFTNTAWQVTGGTITNGGEINDDYCKIVWDDIRHGSINISTVVVETDFNATYSKSNVAAEVYIRFLNGVTASQITGNT